MFTIIAKWDKANGKTTHTLSESERTLIEIDHYKRR